MREFKTREGRTELRSDYKNPESKELEKSIIQSMVAVLVANKICYEDVACLAGSLVRETRNQWEKREIVPLIYKETDG
jgi:hypothetical protein